MTKTNRASDLLAYLRAIRARPYRMRPGAFDCAFFAAGWVQVCTGTDLTTRWNAQYKSFDEGRDLLRLAGFPDLADLAAAHLTEIPGWAQSKVGDIAAMTEDGHTALGIIGGPQIHVLSLKGLDYVSLARADRVFRP
ncbi:DUF6950 family protein [Parasedimentitalea huanghaiensis]|uniref:DUF6950 domain-containing protein n=1 Tax=Parasedimentitalea huanghaiensis TaxID=2682100 RepID=A0A6L6WIS1_9RHOB|nr:hypothetical protein [Zongyanglinia huanghaiensis]MVO16859.1 hypothetical protein [Zongyanglinia huanghaiensis]